MSKRTVKIATDSNSGITQQQADQLGIALIPMPFLIDNQEYFEGTTIDRDSFFQHLAAGADIKTSQPSPKVLTTLWKELLKENDEVVYIPMSSGLSGSCATATMLAQDFEDRVFVIDNKRISCTMKQSVLEALELANKGYSGAQISEILHREALNASIYIAVDTLEYLKKGGRITPTVATIGALLNIKPVLQIQGDKLDSYSKVRGMKLAEKQMIWAIEKDIKDRFKDKKVLIKAAYSCDKESADQWVEKLQEYFPGYSISADPLSLSVCCHIGPGALAVVCMAEVDEAKDIVYEI